MTLSQLSLKAHAARMATIIFAPLAVIFACYAPAFAVTDTDSDQASAMQQEKYEPSLSSQSPIFSYLT